MIPTAKEFVTMCQEIQKDMNDKELVYNLYLNKWFVVLEKIGNEFTNENNVMKQLSEYPYNYDINYDSNYYLCYKATKLRVIKIVDINDSKKEITQFKNYYKTKRGNISTLYKVGEIVSAHYKNKHENNDNVFDVKGICDHCVDTYDSAIKYKCTDPKCILGLNRGITYFKNAERAYFYRDIPTNYTGEWKYWDVNGNMDASGGAANGKMIGKWMVHDKHGSYYTKFDNGIQRPPFESRFVVSQLLRK